MCCLQGGSLTSALALSLIAWAVRFIRGRRGTRLQGSASSSQLIDQKQMGKFHAALTPAAVHMLVRLHCPGQQLRSKSHHATMPSLLCTPL